MQGTLIITGSSRGIGAATALLAGQRGYAVCVNYASQPDRAEQVVAAIRQSGGRAIAVQADVSQETAVAALFDQATQELGTVIGLVNNAGITGRLGRLVDLEIDTLRRVIDINLIGTILCAREAVRRMSSARGGVGGAIVNMSSRAAQHASPNDYIHYAATKAAVETFSYGLACEVAQEGIRVNCVSAGIIETEIHAHSGDATRPQRLASRIPAGRAGQPEEVAPAILWLLSEEASYCNGSILAVSGGR